MTTPNQILVPFAKDGLKTSVPQSGTPTDSRASYTEGFPPNTMIPLTQGGIPPYGQDFNGVLNDITTQVQYLQAGAFYPYNAAFAEAIGGYPLGAIILKADGSGRWENTVENNMTDPDSSGAVGWVAAYTVPAGGTEGQALVKASDADGAFSWESIKPDSGVPVGSIEYFAMATPPVGYLIANGAAVGRTTYPELFSAINTTFGAGDGETTFNLPDLINRFAQGSHSPGQKIEAGLPTFQATLVSRPFGDGLNPGGVWGDGNAAVTEFASGSIILNGGFGSLDSRGDITTIDPSRSNPIYGASDTVQPPALTLLPCIKAFDAATNPGLIDITELANEMAGKVDRYIDSKPVRYVIDAYSDAAGNWYRKWSDGWVEQGIYSIAVTADQMTVTLPVAFASDSYTVVTEVIDRGAADYGEGVSVSARTSSGIVCHGYHSDGRTAVMMSLYVCGQGA